MDGQIKLGIRNVVIIGVIAVLFIVITKVVFTKFPVPGVSDIIQSV